MRLSDKQIKALQALLKEQTGHDYSAEEAQRAGLAIMRFIASKHYRSAVTLKESKDGATDD